jgi:hypothetical protein
MEYGMMEWRDGMMEKALLSFLTSFTSAPCALSLCDLNSMMIKNKDELLCP